MGRISVGVVSTEEGRGGAGVAGGTEGRGVEGRRGEGRGVVGGRVEGRGGLVGGRANKGVCGGVARLSEPFARRMTVSSGYDCLILVVNTRS